MGKASLTFRELIELIDSSVKTGKIKKDYPDFLKSCRDLGVSSYVLNTIILRAKDNQKDDEDRDSVDYSFFIHLNTRQKKDEESDKEVQTVSVAKTEKDTRKTVWLFLILLLIGCIAESFFLYKANEDTDWYLGQLEKSNSENEQMRNALAQISDMTDDVVDDSSFSNWCSSNHEHSSESHISYRFTASSDDKLSFNYFVSSESGYDFLTITLTGDGISSNELIKTSGEKNSSFLYTFDKTCSYTLTIKYSKDGSINANNDNAGVSNLYLHRNYKSVLEIIHSKSSK